mmetsp:Transcript_23236/g.41964  ORF Transcript_23236/g.41964 Transcript_23236/m.41964 type:complete len:208 (-) Transcript_23236:253-876(-)
MECEAGMSKASKFVGKQYLPLEDERPPPQAEIRHGGPLFNVVLGCLGNILPCSTSFFRSVKQVLLLSWSIAPMMIYDILLKDAICRRTIQDRQNDDSETRTHRGFSFRYPKWWQKTIVLPAALGFYCFLYEFVVEPLLKIGGCCTSAIAFYAIASGILGLHFLSGLAVHLCHTQPAKQMDGTDQQQETTISNNYAAMEEPKQVVEMV